MKKYLIFLPKIILAVLVVVLVLNFAPQNSSAQLDACQYNISILKDGKPYSTSTPIASSEYQKYKLQVKSTNCAGYIEIKYQAKSRGGDYQTEKIFKPKEQYYTTTKSFAFGDPGAAGEVTYKYIAYYEAFSTQNGKPGPPSDFVEVTWLNNRTPQDTDDGSGSGDTPADTPSGPQGKADIDTSVTGTYTDPDKSLGSFFNPLNFDSIPELIVRIIQILLALVASITVITIIISGFRLVLSSGNPDQVTQAKKALTWAIIGFAVSLLAFSIVAIVQRII